MAKTLPVPIPIDVYNRLPPVEQMQYDLAAQKEGYDFRQSKRTVPVKDDRAIRRSSLDITIPGAPEGYDAAEGRGGGEFYAPAEGEILWQEKDEFTGEVTYEERAPGSEARKVRFESAAELKKELERRRVQGEFPRGRGGLYGLIPYAEYEKQREEELARERADRLEAKVEKLGPVAAREDVETPTDKAPSTPVPDKPVKDDGASAAADDEGITEQERAERSGFPKGHPSGKEPETEYKPEPESPTTKKAKPRPPEDKPDVIQPSVEDVTLPEDPAEALGEEITAKQREEIEAKLSEGELFKLEEALKLDEEEEPDTITVGDEGEEITLRGLTPSQEIPEPPEDPDLTDVELAEEPPEPPMEAAAEDPAAETRPVVDKPEAADIDTSDLQLEEEGAISAAEIEDLAADVPGGFEYLKNAFREFNRSGYRSGNVFDRRRMEFLIDFLNKADYPQDPEELKLVAQKAFERLQTQLSESTEAAGQRLKANIGKE